jgi:HEAT repeat protein
LKTCPYINEDMADTNPPIALLTFLKMSNSNRMDAIEKLIKRVQKTQHGFLDIQKAADEVFAEHTAKESLKLAQKLFNSEIYQVRSLATFILGRLAFKSRESLSFLKAHVSKDDDWRVQEILAKAFDRFCADVGYKDGGL